MSKAKMFRTGKRGKKKSFWWNFMKKRKSKPKMELAVKAGPKKYKTEPDQWKPPFTTKKKDPPIKVDKKDLIIMTDPNGFDLGKVTATVGIMLHVRMDYAFQLFVDECLERFQHLDWGGVNDQERQINNRRISAQTGIVCGIYTELTSGVQIWIATDLDQGITRICLSEER